MGIFDYKWEQLKTITTEQLEILYRYNMLSDEGKDYFIHRLMKNSQDSTTISKEQTDSTSNLQGQIEMKSKSSLDTNVSKINNLMDKDYSSKSERESADCGGSLS
jgi:hypothetical protein